MWSAKPLLRSVPFKPTLSAMRSKAMAEAKLMEIANETGFSRRKVVEIVEQAVRVE